MNASRLAFLVSMLGLAGCATPRPALDAANNTAGLVAEMDKELREFRRVQAIQDRHRKEIVRELAEAVEVSERTVSENNLFGAATAAPSVQATERSLKAVTVGLAEIDAKAQSDLAALDKRLAELTSPLPATTDKAVAVQKALTLMGSEVAAGVRFAEFQAFYQTVREGVEKNRQKIKDAEEKAEAERKAEAALKP